MKDYCLGSLSSSMFMALISLSMFMLPFPVQAAWHSFFVPGEATPGVSAQIFTELNLVRRQGDVLFDGDVEKMISRVVVGDELGIAFFDDVQYTVFVTRVQHHPGGGLTLFGRLTGQTLATFTLTAQPPEFLLSLQDMSRGMKYRVVGSLSATGGRVKEMDLARMPISNDVIVPVPSPLR